MRKTFWGLALPIALAGFGAPAPVGAADRLQTRDIEYRGAFQLPTEGTVLEGSWTDLLAWCKGVEAHYPDGDAHGPSDGYPGSLFGVGHAWVTPAFEISIPAPVRSESIDDLPVAELLQGPTRILDGIAGSTDELKGIEWLPALGTMSEPKLHVSFGKHYQYNRRTTHGWADVNLGSSPSAGAWYVGPESMVSDLNTNEYIFTIPKVWADANVGGKRLACGRHREGQVATGPSIIAYAPWESGNPPPAQTTLSAKPLVLYRDLNLEDGLDEHCWADNWMGGAWLDNGEKAAVAIVGNKGYGDCWYGWPDGMTAEECEQLPGGCEANGYGGDNRGFCASYYRCVILLYDPADLARVAGGSLTSYDVQPYAVFDITPYMIAPEPEGTDEIHMGGVAYDTENGLLYVSERYGDESRSKPIIHVFSVLSRHAGPPGDVDPVRRDHGSGSASALAAGPLEFGVSLDRDAGLASIRLAGPAVSGKPYQASVYDITGRLVQDLGESTGDTFTWPTEAVADGVYFVRVQSEQEVATRKVVLVN